MNQCGGKTRAGGKCKRPAGEKTDHKGYGPCWRHGGNLPGPRKAASKAEALAYAAERFGQSNLQPTDAMLACVRDAAGMVAFFKTRTAELEAEDLVANGKLHPWAELQMRALDMLARYSKMALDANVAERQVQLAERMGLLLASAMERVLDALDLPDEKRRLAVMEWGKAIAELETEDTIEGTTA